MASYGAALPVLRRHHDRIWEARLLNNRGTLHMERGHFKAALIDLAGARHIYLDHGLALLAADAQWNLGLVAARQGDVPTALELFDSAHSEQVSHGAPKPEVLLDRAEVLLSVGLSSEARDEAQTAVVALADAGQDVDLAHAVLILAQARLADGDFAGSAGEATRARGLFSRQQRSGWATLARLVALRADELAGRPLREVLTEAIACADVVGGLGWPVAEVEARSIAARVAIRLGDVSTGRLQLERVSRHQRLGSLSVRIQGHHARALLHEIDGDTVGIRNELAAGMRVLGQYQEMVGATELRAFLSTAGAELVTKGLELAMATGDARAALRWADLGRARATRSRPVRPPRDARLTAALSRVRFLQAQTVQAQLDGVTPPSRTELRSAEQEVLAASRKLPGVRSVVYDQATPRRLSAELGSTVLVEFIESGEVLNAVVVAKGRVTMHPLGPAAPCAQAVEVAHFLLRRLAGGIGSPRSQQRVLAGAERHGHDLQQMLFGPMLDVIGGRQVVIVPSATLQGLPWALIPLLRGRPFRVAPSAAAWLLASSAATGGGTDPVLVRGPGLPHAAEEIDALMRLQPAARVVSSPAATADDVLAAMDGAALVHIAAHGTRRADNPLFSALELDDGPLTVYDIEGVSRAPAVVVLSSCESGSSATRAGDELLGLMAALLSIGSRSVVATGIATPDAATAAFMASFHTHLGFGLDPAAALAAARADVDPTEPGAYATAAGFACFGA